MSFRTLFFRGSPAITTCCPLRSHGGLVSLDVELSFLSFFDELALCLEILLIRIEYLVLLFLRALLVLQSFNYHFSPEVAHQELERDRYVVRRTLFFLPLATFVTPSIDLRHSWAGTELARVLCRGASALLSFCCLLFQQIRCACVGAQVLEELFDLWPRIHEERLPIRLLRLEALLGNNDWFLCLLHKGCLVLCRLSPIESAIDRLSLSNSDV